jgi:hypothetical protein
MVKINFAIIKIKIGGNMKSKKISKRLNLKKFTIADLQKIKAGGTIPASHYDEDATCWTDYLNSQCSGGTRCETEDCSLITECPLY